ncbi:Nramp family divalent metal transporter [Alsobacter sp. R-9]
MAFDRVAGRAYAQGMPKERPPGATPPQSGPADPPRRRHVRHTVLRLLGPGLVAGAADDDPSGIATYSQAGAQFGYGMLWTVILTYPFMVAIQVVGARIGRTTGSGIIANVRTVFPRWTVLWLVMLLLAANTINIAADLAAMGAALKLVAGGHAALYALLLGVFCAALEVFVPYRRYAPLLKGLTMVLFVYVATVLSIRVPWSSVVDGALVPSLSLEADTLVMVVAIFGTTISPYVFFWQAAEEVEDLHLRRHGRPLREATRSARPTLRRIGIDTAIGMAFSIGIAACIMITTAATLNANGMTHISTSAEAAEALRPLAGEMAFLLFAAGIIGTGLLAVPVLAGSAAYAVAEAMDWRSSLEDAPRDARGFYAIVAGSTLIGALIALSPLDPIRMLFWTAVINGVVAVPVMAVMMTLVSSERVMGPVRAGMLLRVGGWAATGVMAVVVVAMLGQWALA